TGPAGTASALSAASAPAPSLPPVSTGAPNVSGSVQLGQVLASDKGAWAGKVSSYAYQWLRCDSGGSSCAPIDGATRASYTSKTTDIGHPISVQVTALGPGGSTPAVSSPTVAIAPLAIVNQTAPSASGSTVVGNKLTADKGTWKGTITAYAYQWYSCDAGGASCAAIAGATNSGYTTKVGDIGHTILVKV